MSHPAQSDQCSWISSVIVRMASFQHQTSKSPTQYTCRQIPPFYKLFYIEPVQWNTSATVSSFQSEPELLNSWYRFVRHIDLDCIGGHNIVDFDLRYFKDRVNTLKSGKVEILGRSKLLGLSVTARRIYRETKRS